MSIIFYRSLAKWCQVNMQPLLFSSSTRDLWKRRSQFGSTNWCLGGLPLVEIGLVCFWTKRSVKREETSKAWSWNIESLIIWDLALFSGDTSHWILTARPPALFFLFFDCYSQSFSVSGSLEVSQKVLECIWYLVIRRTLSGVLTLVCFPLWKSRYLRLLNLFWFDQLVTDMDPWLIVLF